KIYHYDIIITPDVPPTLNRNVCAQFEVLYLENDPQRIKPAYDGRRNLFTAKPFPFGDVAVILLKMMVLQRKDLHVVLNCVQGRHMFQAKKQYCANVCLKMNVKLGGINSFIN